MDTSFISSISRRYRGLVSFTLPAGAAIAFAALNAQGCGSDPATSTLTDSGALVPDGNAPPSNSDSGTAPDTSKEESDTGSDANGAAQLATACAAITSHNSCPGQGGETCLGKNRCIYAANMYPESTDAWAKCYASPTCGTRDQCRAEAGKVRKPAGDTWVADCFSKRAICNNNFDDDLCSDSVYAWYGFHAQALVCLAKDCAQVETCMEALEQSREECP